MTHSAADLRRVAEIDSYGVLVEPPGRDLQALVDLSALVCEVPTAAINIITADQQRQVATKGFDASVCAREDSMCAAVMDEPDSVVVEDARLDARFRDNPFVTGALGQVRFYASAPLTTSRGVMVGRLCVFDVEPRELSVEQTDALGALADRIVDVLELRLRTRQLESSLTALTHTRDELRRSNEQLARFAGDVSHDLRTPLTAMMLNTELAAHEPAVASDRFVSGLLNAALQAGRRMTGLMDGMLESAHAGAHVLTESVDLADVVDEVLDDLVPLLREQGGKVDVGQLPCVKGNRDQLYSVFLNLLSNAVRFARPGVPPLVSLSSVRLESGWRVEVADNGIGVPEDRREAVFALFARAEPRVGGTGIGLATVKRAIDAHEGRIGLAAAPGGGTTVWFELPD